MNAMGLKADALGYPAVNGPAGEVTHFGYSDKTEDFCGGEGAIPDAKIHNPGEYRRAQGLNGGRARRRWRRSELRRFWHSCSGLAFHRVAVASRRRPST